VKENFEEKVRKTVDGAKKSSGNQLITWTGISGVCIKLLKL